MRHRNGFIAAALVFALHAGTAAAAGTPAVQVAGTVSPAATSTPRVAAVAPSSAIDFEVDLALPDRAGAQALAEAVSTPGNPAYGHYLTPAQFESRYSPTATQVARVTAFLKQAGLHVSGASADRMAIDASGTAASVERTFGVRLSVHRVRGRDVRLADTAIKVPSLLAADVGGISGLDQIAAQPNATTGAPSLTGSTSAPSATMPIPPPAGYRTGTPCSSYYGQLLDTELPPFGHGYPSPAPWAPCGYTGPQLRSAYNLNSDADGSGVTVAVVDAYMSPTLFADAHHFAALNDSGNPLPQSSFSELNQSSYDDTGWCGPDGWWEEQTLDVEAVHDTAPGAHILAAAGKNCGEVALNHAVRQIVDGHLAQVVSNSYGDDGGDVLDSAKERAAVDDTLTMAAATGVSVMFSSGDNGDEFTTLGKVLADYPPSSPWATDVGGTSLEIGASGQRLGEYAWSTATSLFCNDALRKLGGCAKSDLNTWSPLSYDYGSGGGTSQVYAQPPYQVGVVPASISERYGKQPMRTVPDISMDADPSTGMLVGETQQFPDGTYYDQYRIGGTSVSSPLFAGVVARADARAGHSLGFLNPALYKLPLATDGSAPIDDIGPAGLQDLTRADFVNGVDASDGTLFSTRAIGYQGPEEYCHSGTCKTRNVALHAVAGYDDMTGLGSIGNGFIKALAGQ